jgi:hypothetical protein
MSDANDAVRRALSIPLDDEVCALLLTSPSSELRPLVEGILSGDGAPSARVVSAAVSAIEAAARGEFSAPAPARGNAGGGVSSGGVSAGVARGSSAAPSARTSAPSQLPPPAPHARSAAGAPSSPVDRGGALASPPAGAARAWTIVPPILRPPVCECMATTHALLGLCLHCGKIMCELERGVACSACGATPGGSGSGGGGRDTYADGGGDDDAAARAHRDRLLEYDRTSAARTAVVDDDCAYFASNSTQWLSPAEEAAAVAAAAAARSLHTRGGKGMRISIDILGGSVTDLDAAALEAARLEQLDRVRTDVNQRAERASNTRSANVAGVAGVGVGAVVSAATSRGQPTRVATPSAVTPSAAPAAALGAGTYANGTLTGDCQRVYAELRSAATRARAPGAISSATPRAPPTTHSRAQAPQS